MLCQLKFTDMAWVCVCVCMCVSLFFCVPASGRRRGVCERSHRAPVRAPRRRHTRQTQQGESHMHSTFTRVLQM